MNVRRHSSPAEASPMGRTLFYLCSPTIGFSQGAPAKISTLELSVLTTLALCACVDSLSG